MWCQRHSQAACGQRRWVLATNNFVLMLLLLLNVADAQSFTTKTAAESSTVREASNTLTFTLEPSADIGPGATITIVGMTGTGTGDSGSLNVGGADAARVGSSGSWTQSTGTLVLTVANGQTVPTGSSSVFTMDVQNPGASQTVTITIQASSSCIGDSNFNNDETGCTGGGNTFNGAIPSTTLTTSVLGAGTARPTVTSASPDRVYKNSGTAVTFSGAGSIANGDKIKFAATCGSAGTEVTLDGSASASVSLGSASATGDKICFKDVTVKGTADKIALTWDNTTWVAKFAAYSSSLGEPSLTAPVVQILSSTDVPLSDSCVHGVTQVTATITSSNPNSVTIENPSETYSRSSSTQTFSDMKFSTRASQIEVTFTATAPTHFADMSESTQLTGNFDVYQLIYSRKLLLTRHRNDFMNEEDQQKGTRDLNNQP